MPYRDGSPTLGEQIEEDMRRRFYTDDVLKEARELMADNKRLREINAELVKALEGCVFALSGRVHSRAALSALSDAESTIAKAKEARS